MIKITDTMVLAVLKKGIKYSIEEMEFETEYPIGQLIGLEDDTMLKMSGKLSGLKLEVTQD